MKQSIIAVAFCLMAVAAMAQASKSTYDPNLVKKLGADEFGMKRYVIAFLKAGKNIPSDTAKLHEIQRAHLRNIVRLANDGKMVIAGPFMDGGDIEGIFIFNAKTVDEAKVLVASDPAVQSGLLEFDLRPWYGSAALMEIPRIHKTIEHKSPADVNLN